jgi:superkiller protein 3
MINVIPAILVALASLPCAAQTRPTSKPRAPTASRPEEDPLHDVEALLQKQQYAQAEEKLNSLMPAQAKNAQAWFDLGFALSHQEKTKDAVVPYQKAVELAPDWFEANVNLAIALGRSGNSSAAVPVLKHAITLKPTSGGQKSLAHAWGLLGQALEDSDAKAAATAYDKAAELNPADLDLLLESGFALRRAGDLAGAEQRYTKAAEAGSSQGLWWLIQLLDDQKRYNESAAWLNKRLAQNPQDVKARTHLAGLLIVQDRKEDAIVMLEAAKATSADPEITFQLATLYLDAKQYDKAAAGLQELARAKPGDARVRWDLGSALMHQRKYAEAEAEMLAALKIDSHFVDDTWELAYAAQQNKHYELAIRVLDARAQRLKETATTYWIRAVSYDSLGAVKPAATNYRLFLDADAGKSPDQEFQARHRLKAIEPQR